jgi:acyl-CoA thioesterase-1
MIIMARKIVASALSALTVACGRSGDGGAADGAPVSTPPAPNETVPTVVFLGTSLTGGLGLDPGQAYPAIVQRMIDSAGWSFQVVNAGVSGETSAGGLRRLDWLLRRPLAVLVVELGANDGLRGLSVAEMMRNLQAIVDRTRATYPDARIVLAGMEAPPNMGRQYTEMFRRAFRDVARANGLPLVPFLLDGVGGVPELNQSDGIHPTAEGHEIIARNVWATLEPVLAALAGSVADR